MAAKRSTVTTSELYAIGRRKADRWLISTTPFLAITDERARSHFDRREKSLLRSSHLLGMTVRGNVTWRALRHRLGHALRPFDAAQDMLCASHLFSEPVWLSVHPPVDVDLVALVLRDVEGVSVGIEATVLGHRPAARSLTDAALGQRIQEMLDIGHQPTEVVEAVPRAFPFIHVAARAVRQDRHGRLPVRRPAHHPVLRADFFTRG